MAATDPDTPQYLVVQIPRYPGRSTQPARSGQESDNAEEPGRHSALASRSGFTQQLRANRHHDLAWLKTGGDLGFVRVGVDHCYRPFLVVALSFLHQYETYVALV